jgi:hypothetical protein
VKVCKTLAKLFAAVGAPQCKPIQAKRRFLHNATGLGYPPVGDTSPIVFSVTRADAVTLCSHTTKEACAKLAGNITLAAFEGSIDRRSKGGKGGKGGNTRWVSGSIHTLQVTALTRHRCVCTAVSASTVSEATCSDDQEGQNRDRLYATLPLCTCMLAPAQTPDMQANSALPRHKPAIVKTGYRAAHPPLDMPTSRACSSCHFERTQPPPICRAVNTPADLPAHGAQNAGKSATPVSPAYKQIFVKLPPPFQRTAVLRVPAGGCVHHVRH